MCRSFSNQPPWVVTQKNFRCQLSKRPIDQSVWPNDFECISREPHCVWAGELNGIGSIWNWNESLHRVEPILPGGQFHQMATINICAECIGGWQRCLSLLDAKLRVLCIQKIIPHYIAGQFSSQPSTDPVPHCLASSKLWCILGLISLLSLSSVKLNVRASGDHTIKCDDLSHKGTQTSSSLFNGAPLMIRKNCGRAHQRSNLHWHSLNIFASDTILTHYKCLIENQP